MRALRALAVAELISFALIVGCLVLLLDLLLGCAGTPAKPAAYETELVACSEKSATLAESIRCENDARARYGRPLRDAGGDR